MNSTTIIGTIITILGAIVTAWGSYKDNKDSTDRMKGIQNTATSLQTQSSKQTDRIGSLVDQNLKLNHTVSDLNEALSKQNATIGNLTTQNENLNAKLIESTDKLYGSITGGDSYPEMFYSPIAGIGGIVHHGIFPIYELTARVEDRNANYSTQKIFSVDDFLVDSNHVFPINDLKPLISGDSIALDIVYKARNGDFYQELRYYLINNHWHRATLIRNINTLKIVLLVNDHELSELNKLK